MGLSVHQISPKPLPLESWNSHIVHVLPRQWSNSFQNQFYCPFLLILVKTIKRIVADPKRKLSPPFDSADSVPSLGHPAPGSGKMLSLFTVLCDYSVWVTETGAPGSGKWFSQLEFSSTIAAVARTTFRLDRFRNPSQSAFSCVKREFAVYTLLARCHRQMLSYYVISLRM